MSDSFPDGQSRGDKTTIAERSLIALVWAAIESWGGQLISLAIYLVLARLLGPAEFGLVAMAGVYVALAHLVINQGMGDAIVQKEGLRADHVDTAFWLSFVIGLVVLVLTFFLADKVADLYNEPQLVAVLRWLSFSLLFGSLATVPVALLRRSLDYKPLAVRAFVATFVGGVVALVMAFKGFGVWSLVAQQLVAGLIKLLLLWIQVNWRPGLKISKSALRSLLPFSVSILGDRLAEFGNRQGDKLIIGVVLGPVALGYYVVGYRLYLITQLLLTGFVGQVSISSFSALQNDLGRLRTSFLSVTRLAAHLSFPVYALLAALAPVIVPFLLGDSWINSVVVLQVLCAVGALECVIFFNASVMISLGKPHWKFVISVLNVSLNTLGFLIVAELGIVYVAIVYTVRGFVTAPIGLFLANKLLSFGINTYFRGLALAFMSAIFLFFCVSFVSRSGWFDENTLLKATATGLICISVHCVVVWSLDSEMRELLRGLNSLLKRKAKKQTG